MKKILFLALSGLLAVSSAHAAPRKFLGLNTSGVLYEIDSSTGALTVKVNGEIHSFTLGGFLRTNQVLYYVAAPSGATENAIFTYSIPSGTLLSVIDLDRDGEVRALFSKGRNLYGLFYDAAGGVNAIYKINPATGATTLVLDLSDLDVEPIGGAFTQLGKLYYILAKPNTDSTQRRLVSFKLKAGTAKAVEVLSPQSAPVLCDRLQAVPDGKDFVCLASPTTTQVDVCKLSAKGKAKCKGTLPGIERVGGGFTMPVPSGKKFFAVVYATGESNNQRLVQFNAKGALKASPAVATLLIGAN